MSSLRLPPFHRSTELVPNVSVSAPRTYAVPNEPFVADSILEVEEFLSKELTPRILDELELHLHMIAVKSSSHISALHAQVVKGRTVVITESPDLHLVWYYKTIYLKPLPHCLLNFGFWERYLCLPNSNTSIRDPLSANCRAALGMVRTYAHLIKHESDFRIAKAAHLLPEDTTYSAFQLFIEPFRHISDQHVSPRYHYGQIRLTRLNWAVRLFRLKNARRRAYYLTLRNQTGEYLERIGPPLLFLFASLSLILSSMQIVLAARPDSTWAVFRSVSWGFSIAVMFLVAVISCLGVLFSGLRSLFALRLKEGDKVDIENEDGNGNKE